MQRVLLADALKPETPPRERAQVACAWEKLEERKRILRMRPKPKDIDVDAESVAKRARRAKADPNQFAEPVSCPPRLRTGAVPSGQESGPAD
jgi:hypothetical protein